MDVQPISSLKATMPAVLRSMRESRRPVMIVSKGRPQAVLQDVASYKGTQNAIALLKMMLQSERSVTAKHGSSTKDVLARLRARTRGLGNSADLGSGVMVGHDQQEFTQAASLTIATLNGNDHLLVTHLTDVQNSGTP